MLTVSVMSQKEQIYFKNTTRVFLFCKTLRKFVLYNIQSDENSIDWGWKCGYTFRSGFA